MNMVEPAVRTKYKQNTAVAVPNRKCKLDTNICTLSGHVSRRDHLSLMTATHQGETRSSYVADPKGIYHTALQQQG